MALPLLLGIGAGILGGVSYLTGKSNERKAEGEYQALQTSITNSPWAGTPAGMSLLQNAQEDMNNAGWRDWATGVPNQQIGQTRDFVTAQMMQQQAAQSAAAYSAQQTQNRFMQEQGFSQEAALRNDWEQASQPFRTVQNAAIDIFDALDIGDVNAQTTTIFKLADLLEMGVVTDSDGNRISNAGSLADEFRNQADLLTKGKMGDAAIARLRRQVHTILENNQDALGRVKGGFDTRFSQQQERFPMLKLHDPYTFGTMFGMDQFPQMTPGDLSAANAGGGDPINSQEALAAELAQAQARIQELEGARPDSIPEGKVPPPRTFWDGLFGR